MIARRIYATIGGLIAIAGAGVIYCWPILTARLRSPDETLRLFYVTGDHEPELADPLILAGHRVALEVIQAIADPEMPRRRYAIGFLGDGGFREAIPELQRILTNEGELDYFRGDALEALYQIDPEMGRRLAASFDHRTDYLGQSAGEVLVRAPRLAERRSVWDILRDRWLPQQYE